MQNGPLIHGLIPAAGQGQRFGSDTPKQYQLLAGRTVLAHSINAIASHPAVSGVTVVLAADDEQFHQRTVEDHIETAQGGASRAESVLNGLKSIRQRNYHCEWVLVHDAARPCLPPECLDRLVDQGLSHDDGAILAIPVPDTIKREGNDGCILATVDRSTLWAAQTPQLFPLDRLTIAIETMLRKNEVPTDEAAAMENSGARPLLVTGSTANIKITRPADLVIAEALLSIAGQDIDTDNTGENQS
jgi:2-C-methyl-D-erythritol 4-phosphate cytidylyltransferase